MRGILRSGLLALGLFAMGCGGSEAELESEEAGTVRAADACHDACYATYRRCMIVAGGDIEEVNACIENRQACYATCP